MTAKLCPLCDAALIDITTNSNSELQTHSAYGVVGVSAGMPDMKAKCANGCHINVQASKTSDVLWADKRAKEGSMS